ncbi:MAG: hypothetical protein JO323_17010 [Acidobacteriia bacterium]|nr:hypothetical protein [Terriglobia bacterium]
MKSRYKTTLKETASACGLAVLALMLVPVASACGPDSPDVPYAMQPLKLNPQNAWEGAAAENVARDLRAAAAARPASIVGMWKTLFISMGNTNHSPSIADGTQLDFGYSQWHSDGTELYNSGSRPPATQSFCMGVWVQTGTSTYQVNHFAITYDTTGVYSGLRNFIETITLSPGGTMYSGTMVINIYDTKGNQTDHLTAQVSAQRVTVDTTP